jgi:uncharacterized protein YkwD
MMRACGHAGGCLGYTPEGSVFLEPLEYQMKTKFVHFGFIVVLVTTLGTSSCPGNGINGGGMTATERQLATDALTAINNHRAGKGLAALTWYEAGAQVGYEHGVAMEAGGFFAHVDPNTNTDPATRALNAGITHDPQGSIDPNSGNPFVGENLYMTTDPNATGQGAVDSWIGSSGHHTQIDAPLAVAGAQTMPPWTHCGIGVRKSGNQSWWTAMFFRNPS